MKWLECLCAALLIFAALAYAGYWALGWDWSPQGQWQIVEVGRE